MKSKRILHLIAILIILTIPLNANANGEHNEIQMSETESESILPNRTSSGGHRSSRSTATTKGKYEFLYVAVPSLCIGIVLTIAIPKVKKAIKK